MLRLALFFVTPVLFTLQVHSFAVGPGTIACVDKKTSSTRLFDIEQPYQSRRLDEFDIFDTGLDEDFILFPCPSYDASEIVGLCMEALLYNEKPYHNAGLEVCWNFSSDRCRASQGGSLEAFVKFANNPVFSSMVHAVSWNLKATGNLIPKTNARGEMQTFLIEVETTRGKKKEFLWTLQKERRPPRQNCWLVHACVLPGASYQQPW